MKVALMQGECNFTLTQQSFSVRSFQDKFEEPALKSVVLFEGHLANSRLEILPSYTACGFCQATAG